MESTKSPISNFCHYKRAAKVIQDSSKKNRERQETSYVGGREEGCGKEGGKGLSVAF